MYLYTETMIEIIKILLPYPFLIFLKVVTPQINHIYNDYVISMS